ncbi:MAG: carboxymuconolactone decarboxylase family protein [Candidatus Omnitrophica bacterium]|nr:carboxymuconolactone decarboxylase family protein [Candidatus Omnitrophota bacterium]MCM8810586.1 carboxymuconolactone decarboxylase family protein [Candidatus Omnitrophota bacterium]MCM8832727.1 carboxymuconolactone decarboxylase family protein [Candidatus Omnitrophota bacterium]
MREKIERYKKAISEILSKKPEELKKFTEFVNTVLKDGVLDLKTKELIAVGIAVAVRCSYCIGIHVEKAFKAGATEEEILEAGIVSVLMGGGPAYTYLTDLVEAIKIVKEKI